MTMLGRRSDIADPQFDQEMMTCCLDLAHEAAKLGEVPVGALITHSGEIIARNHNRCETHYDSTAHAERLVISTAGQFLKTWRLGGCTLYVTLEPCVMCAGAIVASRVDRLVFGASDPKAGGCRSLYRLLDDPRLNHRVQVSPEVLPDACVAVLGEFFQARR